MFLVVPSSVFLCRLIGPRVRPYSTIGTHSGRFHCDDALACYMLRILPEYKDAKIVRSRYQRTLDRCDVLVDVGGVYDPYVHRYDHHQRMFNSSMSSLTDGKKPWVTKLSSAGLVYFHFGHRIISTIAGLDFESEITNIFFDRMYEDFIEEVDAIDNGIDAAGLLQYRVTTHISTRVAFLNPSWKCKEQNCDEMFPKAMELVGSEFRDRVLMLKKVWWPARDVVRKAIEKRFEVHKSGAILYLETLCPWKDHLHELERSLEVQPEIKFILYPSGFSKYGVQCVPANPRSFTARLSLPEDWCGLKDEELSRQCGISRCMFVHTNGFLGGNATYQGALEMAVRTLQCSKDTSSNS